MSMPLPSGHLSSLTRRNEFSDPQSSLSVELAVLPSPRGSPMNMPLTPMKKHAMLFMCFFTYFFTSLFDTCILCNDYVRQKNTFGHWTALH